MDDFRSCLAYEEDDYAEDAEPSLTIPEWKSLSLDDPFSWLRNYFN